MVAPINKEYWKKFIEGDDNAFQTIYNLSIDRLFCLGCKYCKDEDTVKDAIQDLFIDLYTYRSNINPEANVEAYLFRSLRRKLFQVSLQEQKRSELAKQGERFEVQWDTEHIIINNEKDAEFLIRLTKEIDLLPDRLREALYLRYFSDLDYNEVANIMGISVATCRTQVYRAISDLRKKLDGVKAYHLIMLMF